MPTSLQKALQQKAMNSTAPYTTSSGQFESCFAKDLDLSEFQGNTKNSTSSCTAYSEALLKIKQEEIQRKAIEEEEEYTIFQAAAARTPPQPQEKEQKEDTLTSILQRMHPMDVSQNKKIEKRARKKQGVHKKKWQQSLRDGASIKKPIHNHNKKRGCTKLN